MVGRGPGQDVKGLSSKKAASPGLGVCGGKRDLEPKPESSSSSWGSMGVMAEGVAPCGSPGWAELPVPSGSMGREPHPGSFRSRQGPLGWEIVMGRAGKLNGAAGQELSPGSPPVQRPFCC